jgi:hypothetical protein
LNTWTKKQAEEIITDISQFWKEMELSITRTIWVPDGWMTWWMMVMDNSRKQTKLNIAATRWKHFQQRIQPNLLLSGWLD